MSSSVSASIGSFLSLVHRSADELKMGGGG